MRFFGFFDALEETCRWIFKEFSELCETFFWFRPCVEVPFRFVIVFHPFSFASMVACVEGLMFVDAYVATIRLVVELIRHSG